jgi:hypothetical protein
VKRLLVALLALITTQAFAQNKPPKDLKQEMAKCVKSETALKRLACFDSLTERLGIEVPSGSQIAKTYNDPAKEKAKAENDQQAARKKFIDDALKYGVIQKIRLVGDYVHIWASPAFYQLDFDMKQNLAGVVFDYYRISGEAKGGHVTIKDSKTGKRIGSYSPSLGLDLD